MVEQTLLRTARTHSAILLATGMAMVNELMHKPIVTSIT